MAESSPSPKPPTPPTREAVARMMSAAAKQNDGKVPSDSGAARVQSAHDRRAAGKKK